MHSSSLPLALPPGRVPLVLHWSANKTRADYRSTPPSPGCAQSALPILPTGERARFRPQGLGASGWWRQSPSMKLPEAWRGGGNRSFIRVLADEHQTAGCPGQAGDWLNLGRCRWALQGVSQGHALERSCCHSTFQCSSHRIRQARRHGQNNNNNIGISEDHVNAHCVLV